jgi:hypothetical protein
MIRYTQERRDDGLALEPVVALSPVVLDGSGGEGDRHSGGGKLGAA